MFISYIIFILNIICLTTSAPTSKSILYDMILEKCPVVHSYPDYKNQQLFNTCKDMKTISEKSELNSDNINNARCSFYFEAFTQYCSENIILNLTVPYTSLEIGNNVEDICNYAKTVKNLSRIFSNLDSCKKICTDNYGYISSICSISFYFAHKKQDSWTDLETGINESLNQDSRLNNQFVKTNMNLEKTKNLNQENTILHSEKLKSTENQLEKKTAENPPKISHGNSNLDREPLVDSAANGHINQLVASVIKQVNSSKNNIDEQKLEKSNLEGSGTTPIILEEVQSPPIHVESPMEKQESTKKEDIKQKTVLSNMQQNSGEPEQNLLEGQGVNEVDDNPDPAEDDMELTAEISPKDSKRPETDESEPVNYNTEMEGDSYFFTYFMILCVIFIVGYVCYHNKQKILALILEGRRGKRQYRGRRPNSANYHKLDSNLEEAITSSCKKNTNNVIY